MQARFSGASSIGPSSASAFTPSPSSLKYKHAFKRASEVMSVVALQAQENMAVKLAHVRPPIPTFNVGDAIEITVSSRAAALLPPLPSPPPRHPSTSTSPQYAQELSESSPMPVRGTVIGKTNRGLDSKFTLLNAWDGEYYTATYVYATPLLRSLKVLMTNRLKTSGLRVRRAKLTYLKGSDPNLYLVDSSTKEPEVLQAEKEERRRLARSGKKVAKVASDRAGAAADKAAKGGKEAAPAAKAAVPAKAAAKK